MTAASVNELRLAVANAEAALKSHIGYYGFDQSNPKQFELENKLAEAQAKLYRETGEINLHHD